MRAMPRARRSGRGDMADESGTKSGSAAAPFTAQDAMAFMQRIWNPFAMPMPGSASGAVTPSDPPPAAEKRAPDEDAASQGMASSAMQSMMGNMMPGMLPFPNPAAMFAALNPVEV